MKWIGRRESGNVEDRRGGGGGRIAAGGGIGALVLAAIVYLLGGDPSQVLPPENSAPQEQSPAQAGEEDQLAKYLGVTLADTEDVWDSLFAANGKRYAKP